MNDFVAFARACGVQIDSLRIGERIFRCPTVDHPNSSNGAYMFDGERGWVQNWETGEPAQWWNSDRTRPWSDAEKRAWASRRQNATREQENTRREAVSRAAALIKSAKTDVHPYLKYKSHPEAYALVLPAGELIVPMRDFRDNSLLGAQVIQLVDNEWSKKMIFGMRAKGAIFRIGPQRASEVFLVEGYATGLSVAAALRIARLNAAVMVCFSAGNLAYVAKNITGRRFVFADNDLSGVGERFAVESCLPYCMSDATGEDANDLHARSGIIAVVKKLMDVRRT